jgi:hypothetical protein
LGYQYKSTPSCAIFSFAVEEDNRLVDEMMASIDECLEEIDFKIPLKIQIAATLMLFRIDADSREVETTYFSASSGNTKLFPIPFPLYRRRD